MVILLAALLSPTHVSYTDTSCTAAETGTQNVGNCPADLCEVFDCRAVGSLGACRPNRQTSRRISCSYLSREQVEESQYHSVLLKCLTAEIMGQEKQIGFIGAWLSVPAKITPRCPRLPLRERAGAYLQILQRDSARPKGSSGGGGLAGGLE